MRLFVGLGNPGSQYAGNRHNIGFMALDRIAADHGFGPWRAKFQGQITEGRLGRDKVLLLKPETFMNLSGQSVRAAVDFYKLEPGDVTVFHDDAAAQAARMRDAGVFVVPLGSALRIAVCSVAVRDVPRLADSLRT